jgi:hypothetical protein
LVSHGLEIHGAQSELISHAFKKTQLARREEVVFSMT